MAKNTKSEQKKGGWGILIAPLLVLVIVGGLYLALRSALEKRTNNPEPDTAESSTETGFVAETTAETTTTTSRYPGIPTRTDQTLTVDDVSKVFARNSVLIERTDAGDFILAEHDADAEIYPASMTKMMSLVTLYELLDEEAFEDTIVMSAGVIAEQEAQMAYVAGFEPGEACRIKDLVYAMMLPSGADAAVMLANYAAGSEAAFAQEMNRVAADIGLEHSFFKNCTGLHEDGHISTVKDMARILEYAISIPFCREVMSTLQYTTAVTAEHPAGITLTSTTLSRMVGNELEDLPNPLHVIGGKTGFTNPAGQCLATWAEDANGKTYICVVAGSSTFQPLDAVSDVLTLYRLTSLPLESVTRVPLDEADLPLYEHY